MDFAHDRALHEQRRLAVDRGILGEYVAKIFEESKGRPLYIVADTWNVVEEIPIFTIGDAGIVLMVIMAPKLCRGQCPGAELEIPHSGRAPANDDKSPQR